LSILNNSNAIPVKGGGYTIDQSLRLRAIASNYLTRTPTTAGNRKTWTYSAWVKLGIIGNVNPTIFSVQSGISVGTPNLFIWFRSGGLYVFQEVIQQSTTWAAATVANFKDPSAWYHVVVAVDTTQATSSNRIKMYVNGVEQTLNSPSYPSQNYDTLVNSTNATYIGRSSTNGSSWDYFDGHITEVNFVDGQALAPTEFGEYNEDTGVWQPKLYGGSYGTNGFYIDGTNNGSSTILDQSGNSNNFTSSGMTLGTSSSVNYALMTDVPTLTNEDTGNFCTFNFLDQATMNTVNANLTSTNSAGGSWQSIRGTIGVSSGKWYWEADAINSSYLRIGVGLQTASLTSNYSNPTDSWTYVDTNGNKTGNGSETGYGASYTDGNKIGVALDMDAGTLTFYKNGVSQGVAFNTGLSGKEVFPLFAGYNTSRGFSVNFGQRPFTYTPPTGYKKLNTYNLPDSAVLDGSNHMDSILWNGNGSTQTISGLEFSPDLIWIRGRNFSDYKQAFNTNSGINKNLSLNQTVAEQSGTSITSFNSDGWTMGSWNNINGSGRTYVGHTWRGRDSTAVSNTDGTVTSTVSANQTAGISVVTFTSGASKTVGHGLGATPAFIIAKQTNISNNWVCYHKSLGVSNVLELNTTSAQVALTNYWGSSVNSSTFGTPSNSGYILANGNIIAWCFAEVEGFSKFGSYIGNGSSNGPFVYTGFRPAFIITKVATGSSVQGWLMRDTKVDPYNVSDTMSPANTSSGDINNSGAYGIDILSNGFKVRGTDGGVNQSGGTLIYMAWAENPFKNALAR